MNNRINKDEEDKFVILNSNPDLDEILEEIEKEDFDEEFKGVTDEEPYDEEYLKQFETLPKGYKFTEEELENITNKAFRPLRKQQIYEMDENEGDYYRKISSVNERRTEEFWRIKIGSMLPYDFQKEFHDNLLAKHLGEISEFELDRRQFKRMLKERYEK